MVIHINALNFIHKILIYFFRTCHSTDKEIYDGEVYRIAEQISINRLKHFMHADEKITKSIVASA